MDPAEQRSRAAPVAQAFVAIAERIAARLGANPVRGLLLPAPGAAEGKDAEFCALELEDGSIGLSYLRLGDTHRLLRESGWDGRAAGADPLALARGFASPDPAARAVGLAAVNALSQSLFRRAGWAPPAAAGSTGALEPSPGEHLGMVGLFARLVPRVVEAGARLTVLELDPALAGAREGWRVTLDPADLAGCDRVMSTSTVLLNCTLDAVLAACRGARAFDLVGPTAGCAPDPLFARGVGSVGGTRVVDLEAFRAALREGGRWGEATAKYTIRREEYPGVEALLARCPPG